MFLIRFLKALLIENAYFLINPFTIWKDWRNYFYARRTVKKFVGKKFWVDGKWRIDYWGMPYTVINYKESFFQEPEKYQKTVILRDLAPIIQEFYQFDCYEILSLEQKRLRERGEDTDAILIYFRPIFWYFSWRAFFLSAILYGSLFYIYRDKIMEFINVTISNI